MNIEEQLFTLADHLRRGSIDVEQITTGFFADHGRQRCALGAIYYGWRGVVPKQQERVGDDLRAEYPVLDLLVLDSSGEGLPLECMIVFEWNPHLSFNAIANILERMIYTEYHPHPTVLTVQTMEVH